MRINESNIWKEHKIGKFSWNHATHLAAGSSKGEPIPSYRKWGGETRKPWQWFHTLGAYDAKTFNSANEYNTKHLKTDAYHSIRQRHRYYEWTQSVLDKNGNDSKWFAAAGLVTNWNAVGGAELPDVDFVINDETESFLTEGNEYLFKENMKNAKGLIENDGSLTGFFTDANGVCMIFTGLCGIDLDYTLVCFEQSLVQTYITEYEQKVGSVKMNEIINNVSGLFSGTVSQWVGDPNINKVMNEHFSGGKSFDFKSYNDRVKLGQKLIDELYK
mgnify:CR=1 FL=1